VRTALPGGPAVWVVTEEALARRVLTDPRFAKDTALAPPEVTDLEPSVAERAVAHHRRRSRDTPGCVARTHRCCPPARSPGTPGAPTPSPPPSSRVSAPVRST
jgi:hypothetical protein